MSNSASASRVVSRSPITVAAGFIGAFIVGSLGVQMVRHQSAVLTTAPSSNVEPVITSQATLWSSLGERDFTPASAKATAAAPSAGVQFIVGSEATLWSSLGLR